MQFGSLGWEDPLEEEMTTRSSILSWRIPWTEDSGRLQSIGWHRVRQDWSNFTCMHVNSPTCRYVFNVSVKGVEFCFLLLQHLDLESLILLSFSQNRQFLFLYNWLVAQICFLKEVLKGLFTLGKVFLQYYLFFNVHVSSGFSRFFSFLYIYILDFFRIQFWL